MFNISDILLVIGCSLECLLLYVIATQTPKPMRNIQGYLFVVTFGEVCIVICYLIVIIPEGVRGLPGVTINGLLKYLGYLGGIISAIAGCSMFSVPLVSIFLCSLIRLLTVFDIEVDRFRPLFNIVLIFPIFASAIFVPVTYSLFFLDNQKLSALAKEQNLSEVLDDLILDRRPYLVFNLSSVIIVPAGSLFIFACGTGALLTIIINIATHARSMYMMSTSSIMASRHDLQRRLMFTLLAQIGVPIAAGIIVFIVCIPMIRDYFATGFFDVSEVNSILYYLSAAYSIASVIPTLILIRPYRIFVMNLIYRKPTNSILQAPAVIGSPHQPISSNRLL